MARAVAELEEEARAQIAATRSAADQAVKHAQERLSAEERLAEEACDTN